MGDTHVWLSNLVLCVSGKVLDVSTILSIMNGK